MRQSDPTKERGKTLAEAVIAGHHAAYERFGGSADGVDFSMNDDYALAQAYLELEAEQDELREGRENWLRLRNEIDSLVGERDAYREALEVLGHPNWSAKPTGKDAREMASFARTALERPS